MSSSVARCDVARRDHPKVVHEHIYEVYDIYICVSVCVRTRSNGRLCGQTATSLTARVDHSSLDFNASN